VRGLPLALASTQPGEALTSMTGKPMVQGSMSEHSRTLAFHMPLVLQGVEAFVSSDAVGTRVCSILPDSNSTGEVPFIEHKEQCGYQCTFQQVNSLYPNILKEVASYLERWPRPGSNSCGHASEMSRAALRSGAQAQSVMCPGARASRRCSF
jgi:hypothetical protein